MAEKHIVIEQFGLCGDINWPPPAEALIVFAHGSGSGRLSPRNRAVARALYERGFATFLFDLLTPDEESDRSNVFDIPLLGDRLVSAIGWLDREEKTRGLHLGLFGASTGAAAALVAAARAPDRVGAVVSRGGRPDLALSHLPLVRAPTLLVVGGADFQVIELNEIAFEQMQCSKALEIVPGATHLFSEAGALEKVIELAADWFERYLGEGST
jgi:pimeloyl-ACP methyl ester carboxylesterase